MIDFWVIQEFNRSKFWFVFSFVLFTNFVFVYQPAFAVPNSYPGNRFTAVKIDKKWGVETNGAVVSSPAVKEGVVVFGTRNPKHGKIKAVSSRDGKTIWEHDTGDEVWASPAIAGDSVYIGGTNGWFYCFDLHTGQVLWKKKLKSMFGSPVVRENKVIACAGSSIYALDRNDGKIIWEFDFPGKTNSTPAVWAGKVYFGGGFDYPVIFALNLATGEEIWHRRVKDSVDAPITVTHNTVLFGDWDNTFYAFDAQTGQLKWEVTRGGDTEPAVVSGSAAVHKGMAFWGHGNGDFMAVDINSGREIWSYENKPEWRGSPLISDEMLITLEASSPAKLLFIRPKTGKIIQQISFPGKTVHMLGTPAINNKIVYAGFGDKNGKGGYLQALRYKKYELEVKQEVVNSANTGAGRNDLSKNNFSELISYQVRRPFKPTVAENIPLEYGIVGDPLYLRDIVVYGDWAGWVHAYDYSGELLWKNSMPRAVVGSPIRIDNKIIVTDRSGKIAAFDRRSGEELWGLDMGAKIKTGPVKMNTGFVVGDKKGRVVLINSDGSRGWVENIYAAVTSLSKREDVLMVGGENGAVLALNGGFGKRRWKFRAEYGIATPFEVTKENVYFGDWLGNIYCLDLDKPEVMWKFKMDRAPEGEIVFTRGLLHAYSRDGTLSALHPVTGKKIWEYKFSPLWKESPIFYEGSFYGKNKAEEFFRISYGTLKSPGQNSFVNLQKTGFSPGSVPKKISEIRWRWRRKYHDETPVSPVSKQNLLYVVSGRKLIILRDFPFVDKNSYFAGNLQRTGVFPGRLASSLPEEEWSFEAEEEITSSPALGQKHVYVPAGKVLYALDYGGRETAWEYRGKHNFTEVQYYKGIVYAGTKGGKVIAFSVDNGEIIWQSDNSIVPLRISLSDGYLATANSKLQYAVFKRRTGKLLWNDLNPKRSSYQNFNSSLEVSPPIISRGRIIFQEIREPSYRNEKLFLKVASAKTGKIIRKIKINQGKGVRPCRTILLKGNKCYLLVRKKSSRDHLLAVNILTGKIKWEKSYQDQLVWASGATMDKEQILITGHHPEKNLISLFLVNTEDGALVQKLNLSAARGRVMGLRPVAVNNRIYIQGWKGTVFSLR